MLRERPDSRTPDSLASQISTYLYLVIYTYSEHCFVLRPGHVFPVCPMSEHPVLDPEAIAGLRALGGDDGDVFFREIVGIFLADTPMRLQELDSSLRGGDDARFIRAA